MQRFRAGGQKSEQQLLTIVAGALAVLLTSFCGWEGPPPRVPKTRPPQPPMMQEIYSIVLSALSPDGTLVAGANRESSTIKISKVPDNRIPVAILTPDCPIQGRFKALFSPDSSRLAFMCWDRRLAVWDFRNSKTEYLPLWQDTQAGQIAWSNDSKFLAAAAYSGRIKIWNRGGPESREFATSLNAPLDKLLFTGEGHLLISDARGKVSVWNRSGQQQNSADFGGAISGLLALPNGNQVLVVLSSNMADVSKPSKVLLWDISAGTRNSVKGIDAYNPHPLAFSANGEYLVVQFNEGASAVFSMVQNRYVKSLSTDSLVTQGAFSSDGTIALMGKTVSMWHCCP